VVVVIVGGPFQGTVDREQRDRREGRFALNALAPRLENPWNGDIPDIRR
jgi:hypothetical protein